MTTINERCSCGATIAVTGGKYDSTRNPANPRSAAEIVERWRAEHRHEFPPQPAAATIRVGRAAARPGKVRR